MNNPKVIYIGKTIWSEEKISDDSPAYFSEELIRAIANELYNSGDAFIAKLNGKSFSEYLKGESDD